MSKVKARKCQYCNTSDHMTMRDSNGVVHGPRYYACFKCQPSMSTDEYGEFSRRPVGSDFGDLNFHRFDLEEDDKESA